MEMIKYYRRDPSSTYAGAEVSLMADDNGYCVEQIACVINDEDVEIMYERAFTSRQEAHELYMRKKSVIKKLFV